MTRATAPTLHPWDLQPGDSLKAFEAFQLYRGMGTGRTLEAVALQCQKSVSLINRWAQAGAWVERVRAFDAEVGRKLAERDVNDHIEVRSRQAQLGRMMQARGAQRIGQLDPSTLEAKEARALAVEGAKMEREALGIPASVAVTGADGGPVETVTRVTIDLSTANVRAVTIDAGDEAAPDAH